MFEFLFFISSLCYLVNESYLREEDGREEDAEEEVHSDQHYASVGGRPLTSQQRRDAMYRKNENEMGHPKTFIG